jgi:hypothetical protein
MTRLPRFSACGRELLCGSQPEKSCVSRRKKNVGAEILWRRSSDRCPEIHFQILELQGNRHSGQCHDQQERSGGLSPGSERNGESNDIFLEQREV